MAQNITLMGASYSNVPGVNLPKTGGGQAYFVDSSDADAASSDIASGKTAYVNGTKITGTNSGGGSSLNVQATQSTTRTTATAYTQLITLTCASAGTYDVYWTTTRTSTSGTWGSQLYLGSSSYGTANTTFTNHVQNVHLTGVQIAANEAVSVRARSRGNSYYAYVPQLTIIQTK